MLKTCYGLCSLRTGAKVVAFYELICTILLFLSVFIYELFSKIYQFHDEYIDVYYFLQSCIIIITLLKLFASVSLMQSTFRNAPSKIFFWIVTTCIIYLMVFLVSINMYVHKMHRNTFIAKSIESGNLELLMAFILINSVFIIEIHVVVSYYQEEKHLEQVEQCMRTHTTLSSRITTRRDLENKFILDFGAFPITQSAEESETTIFTSFKGVPV